MGQNVLRAVTFNGVQLLMTALLALIILYFFAVLEFLLLRTNFFLDDFSDLRACDTLMDCFLVTVREGLINGGVWPTIWKGTDTRKIRRRNRLSWRDFSLIWPSSS